MKREHFGKCPTWLSWIFCKRTNCTYHRRKLLHLKVEEQTSDNPIIDMFYGLDKK